MKVIKLTKLNQQEVIKSALAVLKTGGVIVYPTETAYGLGADYFSQRAVKKVYQIKGRDFKKQLSVIVGSLAMAKRLVKFDQVSMRLAKKHWPGPLTLVLPLKSSGKTLALRISSNRLALSVVKKLNGPVTATSANLSGKGEYYSAEEIIKQFAKRKYQPDLIIDAGRLPKQKPSTIAQIIDGQIKILRQGVIVIPTESRR